MLIDRKQTLRRCKDGDRVVWGLNKRISNYQPEVLSPHNLALVKDLEPTDTPIRHPHRGRTVTARGLAVRARFLRAARTGAAAAAAAKGLASSAQSPKPMPSARAAWTAELSGSTRDSWRIASAIGTLSICGGR